MQVLGVLVGANKVPRAVHIYRITLPFTFITKKTRHTAIWTDAQEMATTLSAKQIKTIIASDIIVLGRAISKDHGKVQKYLRFLKQHGAKLVYETDDDLTEEFRDTSSGREMSSLPFIENDNIDAFTATTPQLCRQIGKHSIGQPCYVLPNSVETDFFTKKCRDHVRTYQDTLNIMLVGTPTHGDDWVHAHKAALRILEEHPNTRLIVGGFQPDYIGDDERVVKMPFVEYFDYPKMIAEADIVMCSIDPEDQFNHSKSAVKAMEAWSARRTIGKQIGGAAVVATDSIVYNGTVKHEKNGLIVQHTVDSYYNALKRLVQDNKLRHHLQAQGLRDVVTKHSMARNYKKWVSAYTNLRRQKQ